MVAIPVLRSRVAPVLNWCSTIHIYPDEPGEAAAGREIVLANASGPERLRILKQEGVQTIICGALSRDLLMLGEGLGLHIIHGIAGDVTEVLHAYRTRSLDLPCYWLPGCHGPRRYRGGGATTCPDVEDNTALRPSTRGSLGERAGNRKSRTAGAGPGGFCVCPRCGARTAHVQGIPCSQVLCSRCEQPMTRA